MLCTSHINTAGSWWLTTLQLLAQVVLHASSFTSGHRWSTGLTPGQITKNNHLSISGRQDKCIAVFPNPLVSSLFIPPLLPCLLFILMWSRWSSWWWHGVDYAVPTVTYSKAVEEDAIVASDLWMTALPVAPAPHWRSHGERRAGRACSDMYATCRPILASDDP